VHLNWVCVQKPKNVTFSSAFSSRYAKTRTSNFRNVVRQHTEGMVESITWILLEIYLAFQQWKIFENPLRIDKVIAMSWCTTFLGHGVFSNESKTTPILLIRDAMNIGNADLCECIDKIINAKNVPKKMHPVCLACVIFLCNCSLLTLVFQGMFVCVLWKKYGLFLRDGVLRTAGFISHTAVPAETRDQVGANH